jgi:apolipoprotein N-acyltransferase
MLPIELALPGLAEAVAAGARTEPWMAPLGADELEELERLEQAAVGARVFGAPSPNPAQPARLLPEGASFLAGVECLQALGSRVRRVNAAVLWDAEGRRQPPALKRYLVPGGETMFGLERLAPVRALITAVAGYVPDFAAGDETGVLELAERGGRRYRFGASICFDNAFAAPYAAPAELDFHVVLSNEAWYRGSFELDQMVAFSRLAAIATGRSFVRVTNSGISLVLGPDGAERARLRRDGRDREVEGWLHARVPVPATGLRSRITPYARSWRVWPWLGVLAPCLCLAWTRRSRR